MSEQGDWQVIEDSPVPAHENNTSLDLLPGATDANLPLTKAAVAQPVFKEDNALQAGEPEPAADSNLAEKAAVVPPLINNECVIGNDSDASPQSMETSVTLPPSIQKKDIELRSQLEPAAKINLAEKAAVVPPKIIAEYVVAKKSDPIPQSTPSLLQHQSSTQAKEVQQTGKPESAADSNIGGKTDAPKVITEKYAAIKSDASPQVMEASVTESIFKKEDAQQRSQPEPAAEINLAEKAAFAANKADIKDVKMPDATPQVMKASVTRSSSIRTKDPRQSPQPNPAAKINLAEKATVVPPKIGNGGVIANSHPAVRTLPPCPAKKKEGPKKLKGAMSDNDVGLIILWAFALGLFGFVGYIGYDGYQFQKYQISEFQARNNTEKALHRLTSIESQITELTEMLLQSSCSGVHHRKDDPLSDPGAAVHVFQEEELLVEAGTEICQQQGSNSQDLIGASPQCGTQPTVDESTLSSIDPLVDANVASADLSTQLVDEGEEEMSASENDGTDTESDVVVQNHVPDFELSICTSSDETDRDLAMLPASEMVSQEALEEAMC